MLLGAHVSIGGGIDQAVVRAKALKCDTFQIFSKSPRSLRAKPLEEEQARKFRDALKASGLSKPVIHDNYLINLSTPKAEMQNLYRKAFVDEMERAQRLNVPYLAFHPGAHVGKGEEYALKRIALNLDWCIEHSNAPDVVLCLENTAGQGTVVGYTFEQLKAIMDLSRHRERLAVCFDTCHAFAAGYDISTLEGCENVLAGIDELIGLDLLKAFHLNDSVGELGSRLDRHQHIGRGRMGLEPFKLLVSEPRFRDRPGNVETPDMGNWNRKNLKVLRSLRGS